MKADERPFITGILIGEAPTEGKAASVAALFTDCPYCAFSKQIGKTTLEVFSVPEDHRWWLTAIEENPTETLGLEKAKVLFTDPLAIETPWTRGDMNPILEEAPCGADCTKCPLYEEKCPGCPSTRYYKEGDA